MTEEALKPISAKIPTEMVENMTELIKKGFANNVSDFVRDAVKKYIQELNGIDPEPILAERVDSLDQDVTSLANKFDLLQKEIDKLGQSLKKVVGRLEQTKIKSEESNVE